MTVYSNQSLDYRQIDREWLSMQVTNLKSGSPSGRLDKVDVETGVVEEGKCNEEKISYEHGDDVQLG